MSDLYPPAVQRPALLKLAEALVSRDNALRRDECGDWRIKGRFGWIYAVPEGYQTYYRGADEFEEPTTARGWINTKQEMPFARVSQDGDTEGILILDRLPTPEEALIIRERLRIPKRAEYSDEVLAQKREQMSKASALKGKKTASEPPEAE
jgi:hypothetical protein